jgi:hypothetical protein
MARVPVTARKKFSEAAYFYTEMIGYRTNSIVFPYYLSAFVSALRSVTYYLQKQYAHDPRFTEWYGKKQEAMKADPALKILHEKRNTALHVEPFDLYFKQGFKLPDKYGGVITTTRLTVREETDATGQIRMCLRVGEDGPEEEVEPQISWHFSEDDPQGRHEPLLRGPRQDGRHAERAPRAGTRIEIRRSFRTIPLCCGNVG